MKNLSHLSCVLGAHHSLLTEPHIYIYMLLNPKWYDNIFCFFYLSVI